jgi:spore photoproduct lyase
LNAAPVSSRLEGGSSSLVNRIKALRKLALPKEKGGGDYPIGVVLAPIMPIPGWQEEYVALFENLRSELDFPVDLTFELITHRFTPGSKRVLTEWYPNTSLDMDESKRDTKINKYGGTKFVFAADEMKQMKSFFYQQIPSIFPESKILYWT